MGCRSGVVDASAAAGGEAAGRAGSSRESASEGKGPVIVGRRSSGYSGVRRVPSSTISVSSTSVSLSSATIERYGLRAATSSSRASACNCRATAAAVNSCSRACACTCACIGSCVCSTTMLNASGVGTLSGSTTGWRSGPRRQMSSSSVKLRSKLRIVRSCRSMRLTSAGVKKTL